MCFVTMLKIWNFSDLNTYVVRYMATALVLARHIYVDHGDVKANITSTTRQRKAWHPLAEGGGTKLTLTYDPRPVTKRGSLLISITYMWSLKVIGHNCSLHCAKKALCTEFQSWPWPLIPWPKINRSSSSHHPQLTCEVWKWLGKNCSRYRAHKVLYTECKSWPWLLTPWPKFIEVPPLIIHKLQVKFESDWAKSVARGQQSQLPKFKGNCDIE